MWAPSVSKRRAPRRRATTLEFVAQLSARHDNSTNATDAPQRGDFRTDPGTHRNGPSPDGSFVRSAHATDCLQHLSPVRDGPQGRTLLKNPRRRAGRQGSHAQQNHERRDQRRPPSSDRVQEQEQKERRDRSAQTVGFAHYGPAEAHARNCEQNHADLNWQTESGRTCRLRSPAISSWSTSPLRPSSSPNGASWLR